MPSSASDQELLGRQAALQAEAGQVLAQLDLDHLFGDVGPVLVVGSYLSGLMCWRDLDVGLLAGEECSPSDVLELLKRVVELPGLVGFSYRDERGERCPTGEARDERYHVPFDLDAGQGRWRIDLSVWLRDLHGQVADWHVRLRDTISDQQRLAVLRIKDIWHRLPSYPDQVGGWEIYTAVLRDGVGTPEQFARWLATNGFPSLDANLMPSHRPRPDRPSAVYDRVVSASEPPEPPEPEVEYRRPAWVEPPADVVPGVVPVELLLARTPQRAIGLTGIRAYPTGFGCTLHLRLREVIPGEQSTFGAFNMFGDGVDPAGEFAAWYLRFGVGFADGRKATNLDHRRDLDEGPAPDPPTLRLVRWEGYDRLAWEVDVWVWGLPPPGPLALVCEWPARGIPESRVEIDAGLVLEAAGRAEAVWPGQAPP